VARDKNSQQPQPNPEQKKYQPWIISSVLIGIVIIIGLTFYLWKKIKTISYEERLKYVEILERALECYEGHRK
jgi:uncharacterized protein HemX